MFPACFHIRTCPRRRESDRTGLAFQRVLAAFRRGVSRPVLRCSKGSRSSFYGVVTFRTKNSRKRCPDIIYIYIYRGVFSEKLAYFSSKSRPKLIREKWGVSTIYKTAIIIMEKWLKAGLGASRIVAGGGFTKIGTDSPVSRVKHA